MEDIIIKNLGDELKLLREQLNMINNRAISIRDMLQQVEQSLQATSIRSKDILQLREEAVSAVEAIRQMQRSAAYIPQTAVVEESTHSQTLDIEEKPNVSAPVEIKQEHEDPTDVKQEVAATIEEQHVVAAQQEASTDNKEKTTVDEKIEEKPSGVTLPPVDDIRKAISLGDRFLFQRELFNGDGEKMNKTIDSLNELRSLDDAMNFIGRKFSWDKESQAYELFVNILKRRFAL